jgi:hypothetical protein
VKHYQKRASKRRRQRLLPWREPDKDKDKGSDLVKSTPSKYHLLLKKSAFRKFLNALVQSKTQFFLPKFVVIENDKLTGPPKVAANGERTAKTACSETGTCRNSWG